ncbi:hypothetical protein OHA37_08160 [Streptomyces sp. NBC_00335]|nr:MULTISPECIES: hypothetical protein [unclassified Streptomyces]MCX5403856.1 hypothetical protein [Streptomyces sp. NBC_00086]
MMRIRTAQAAAVFTLTLVTALFATGTATAAPAQSAPSTTAQDNMGWQ